jgi:hypothetical protein
MASYAGSFASAVLTVQSKVSAGILHTLTLFPATVVAGNISHGTVTLEQKVATDTVVGLAAVDSGVHLPPPGGGGSSIASVPASITINAGSLSGGFQVHTPSIGGPATSRAVTIIAGAVVTKYARLTVTR